METYTIEKDIQVYCLTAKSFPEGLPEVYGKLHTDYPVGNGSSYYGISHGNKDGSITYMAAVRPTLDDKTPEAPYQPFTIRKGQYRGDIIRNFMQDTNQIGKLFTQLLQEHGIAKDGYCLEVYLNPTDVRCMVLLEG